MRRWSEEDLGLCQAFCATHSSVALRLLAPVDPPVLGISISGDLDTTNSADFLKLGSRLIPSALAAGGLMVELAGLRYISSTGIGALASLMTETEKREVPFFLTGVKPRAQSIFEALGLWSFFTVLPSFKEEA